MEQERLVPVAVMAYELNMGTRDLERRCNGGLVLDELGLRCVPATLVRQLLADRDHEREVARQRKAAEREEQAQHREQALAERRARKARAAAQREMVEQGLTAHEVMTFSAGEFDRRAGKLPTADYLSGNMEYHPIRERN